MHITKSLLWSSERTDSIVKISYQIANKHSQTQSCCHCVRKIGSTCKAKRSHLARKLNRIPRKCLRWRARARRLIVAQRRKATQRNAMQRCDFVQDKCQYLHTDSSELLPARKSTYTIIGIDCNQRPNHSFDHHKQFDTLFLQLQWRHLSASLSTRRRPAAVR